MRRLAPDEAALWGQLAKSVTRLGQPRKGTPRPLIADAPEPVARRGAAGTTLDAAWDRKLAKGEVAPDRTVDLHEMTVAEAHRALDAAIGSAVAAGARLLVVVAGKARDGRAARLMPGGRGIIAASVEDWLALSPFTGNIAAVRRAHVRHGGAGALYVVLRRRR
ncbi:Putative DNA endonuclease SmrA [Sphingomonas antarctica]|uniref:Smr/MutS family protein n=1 Tax=Sphingomonas antarctica TaxID=2040274 RepID=UPI0039ED8C95